MAAQHQAKYLGEDGYKRNYIAYKRFPDGSNSKELAFNARDLGLIPGLGRSPGGGHGNYSGILAWRIRKDRGAWQAAVHGVTKSQS